MTTPDDRQRSVGGRYRLSGRIGSGAMGTVWSGYDEVLQRRVAVKELTVPPGLPEREAMAMRERMLREARALGGLSHPNVITVYDVVDVGGEPLVVLELVPSRNLATMITEQGSLSTRQAAVVGFATAAALRAAHRAGITHRDVKPGNVLVADDGRVKLTDFGIARNAADAPMTTTGLVLGSPAYIAPEVAAGRAVTPAADLWGLGATLFAAVEGHPPYDVRGDPVATITEVVDGEVPRPRVGGPVAEVISALMVKEPARRMALDEVRRRLRPLVSDPDDPLYPGSPDAPMTAAPVTRPAPEPAAAVSDPAAPRSSPVAAGLAPLLADTPGPMPASPPGHVRPPDRRPAPVRSAPPARGRAGWAVLLVTAGAATVLAGAALGWTGTRALAGQSPLTTVTVTTDRAPTRIHQDPLGFTARVPEQWTEFRFEPLDGEPSVSFVSPDGTGSLTVARYASAAAVIDDLTEPGPGTDTVELDPPQPTAETRELVLRTEQGGLRRTSLLRLVPAPDGVWTVALTVPSGPSEGAAAALFQALADGFTAG